MLKILGGPGAKTSATSGRGSWWPSLGPKPLKMAETMGGVPGRAVQVDQVLQVHGALEQAPRLFADGGGRLPELSGSASVERVLRRDEQLRGLRHRSHLVMEEHEERGLGQGRG